MSNIALQEKLKGATNNNKLPYLGGIVCNLPIAENPARITIRSGLDYGNTPLPVTIKIEGDATFTDSGGTPIGKTINLPDGETHHWFTASGDAYLHILPISNLGYSLYLDTTNAKFCSDILKLYEREDNKEKLTVINFKNTQIYGSINNLPNSVTALSISKFMYGNIAELNKYAYQVIAGINNVTSIEYKGTRKGNDTNMVICSNIDLGSYFDSYIKDCAECNYRAGDTSIIEVFGTTNYDTDSEVQDAVATVYSKGVTRVWITDPYGNRRLLGNPT